MAESFELQVHMNCPGCERKIRRAIYNVKGIQSIGIDREQQKVTIVGYNVDRYEVVQRLRRAGRKAQLWTPAPPFPLTEDPALGSTVHVDPYTYGPAPYARLYHNYNYGSDSMSNGPQPISVLHVDGASMNGHYGSILGPPPPPAHHQYYDDHDGLSLLNHDVLYGHPYRRPSASYGVGDGPYNYAYVSNDAPPYCYACPHHHHHHQHHHNGAVLGENMLSEENPNACSVM